MFYSVTGLACPIGQIYAGDMVLGDRDATTEELAAYETSRLPTKDQRIAEKLATRGLTLQTEWLLSSGMASMLAAAAVSGVSEPQLYASNPGYKYAKDLVAEISGIRAEP